MRRIGLFVMAAALAAGPPASAQFQSEIEAFESGANALAADQREVTQRAINDATRALQAKDFAKARRYAATVTRADPKRVESWLLLGAAQQGLGDWKAARVTYSKAVRISPVHPEARAGLGVAYARTGDPKATNELAWLDAKVRECAGCWQSGQLLKLKADVEAAIRETPAKNS